MEGFLEKDAFERLRENSCNERCKFQPWTDSLHRFAAPLKEIATPEVSEALCGEAFTKRLCEFYSEDLLKRGVDPLLLAEKGSWEAVVCYDREGYRISPHVDSPSKGVTTLLYLAADEDNDPERGTVAYASQCTSTKESVTSYAANVWMSFVPGANTWHGVEPVPSGKDRTLVNATLYLPGCAPRGGSWFKGPGEIRMNK